MSGGPPVLWQYTFSNYNEKARWALDYKGIPHRRRSLFPAGPRALWFSRGEGTLPALDLDGRRIVDSTAIIAALEERQPEPALSGRPR
jgi:glutathione S-transferase